MKLLTLAYLLLSLCSTYTLAIDTSDAQNIQQGRKILDPIILAIDGVRGSMIGACIDGSDEDPFATNSSANRDNLELCLVYFVEDSIHAKFAIRSKLEQMGIFPNFQIRFQDPLPPLVEQ